MTFEELEENVSKLSLPLRWENLTITSLYRDISSGSFILFVKNYLAFYKILFRSFGKSRVDPKTEYVFTYSNSLAYNRDLVMGPVEEMQKYYTLAIFGLKAHLSAPNNLKAVPVYAVNSIRSIPKRIIPRLFNIVIRLNLKVWLSTSRFTIKERLALIAFLQLRYLDYYRFYYFIVDSSVKGVVTDYDRHDIWSTLIIASKFHGIKTFTHIHGVIYKNMEYGFTPLISDFAFCWGINHKNTLLNFGESEDRLAITGNPRFHKEEICNEQDGEYYTLVLNPSHPNIDSLINKLIFLARSHKKKVAIKLHPSQKVSDYKVYINLGVEVWDYRDVTNSEVISSTEFFFVISSGYAYDLCFYSKPIFVLSCCGYIGSNRELIDFDAAVEIEELVLLNERLEELDHKHRRKGLILNMHKFSKHYIEVGGSLASKNIKNVIVNNT